MATGASAIFFRTPSSSSSSLLLLFTSGQPFYESPARGAEHGGSLHRRPRPRRRRRSLASSPSAATATHLAQTTISGPEERTDHRPTAPASCRPSKKTFFSPLPPPFLFGETAALVRSFFRSSDVCSSPSPPLPWTDRPNPRFFAGRSLLIPLPPSLPLFPPPLRQKKKKGRRRSLVEKEKYTTGPEGLAHHGEGRKKFPHS